MRNTRSWMRSVSPTFLFSASAEPEPRSMGFPRALITSRESSPAPSMILKRPRIKLSSGYPKTKNRGICSACTIPSNIPLTAKTSDISSSSWLMLSSTVLILTSKASGWLRIKSALLPVRKESYPAARPLASAPKPTMAATPIAMPKAVSIVRPLRRSKFLKIIMILLEEGCTPLCSRSS